MEKADFMQALQAAIEAKASEFDSKRLPQMIENYRLLHTCEKNLFELLVKRSLVKDDPYKNDKKVTKVYTPETNAFNEMEVATVMGIRLADYEAVLDYICGLMNANTQSLDEKQIKKLLDFNGFVDWANLTVNTTHVNTRVICELIGQARNGAQQMTQRLIVDSLNNAKKSLVEINTTLQELAIFAHENAKYNVRCTVMGNAQFDQAQASQSGEAERSEIKRLWKDCMGKVPYNNDLVLEIVAEDTGSDKDQAQQAVLNRLKASTPAKKAQKAKPDPKRLLVEGAVILAASATQLDQVLQKISSNHDALTASRATVFQKLKTALRHAFGLADPPEEYMLSLTNTKTGTRSTRRIDYSEFFLALQKRMKVYAAIGDQSSAQYARIAASSPSVLYTFLTKQIKEMQDVMVLLNALDEYFKTNITKSAKARAKGLKIEMATIGNCVIKARGRCQDFTDEMEEQKQMQALNKAPSDTAGGAIGAPSGATEKTAAAVGGNK